MKHSPLASLAFFLCALMACSQNPTPPKPGPGPATKPDDHGHAHVDPVSLGVLELGGHRVRVSRSSELVPGAELDLDLAFEGTSALPGAVRAWIGTEAATGSRKALLEREGVRGMHGHVEVPKPIPDGARIWVDIEGSGRGSLPLSS